MKTKDLVLSLFNWCEIAKISPSWFNLGLHEDMIEIYTAPEHDEYYYHGSMGCEAKTEGDICDFIRSVKRQNEFYKNKGE